MTSLIRARCKFNNISKAIHQIRDLQISSELFLQKFDHQTIKTEYHLHYLYLILEDKWNKSQMEEIKHIFQSKNIIGGLGSFVNYIQSRALGNFSGVSDQSVEEILKLIYIILQITNGETDDEVRSLVLDNVKNILQHIYSFIYSESKSQKLKSRFLECMAIYRRYGPMINDTMYSEELARNQSNIDQFVDFFIDYLGKQEQRKVSVIQNLLRGLTLRLNTLMETQTKRNKLANLLNALSRFLQTQPSDSEWFSSILRWSQYSKIFDAMLQLTTKNQNYMKLSQTVNRIVQVYMASKIANFQKFQFITKIFKYIIQRSSSFYAFIKTDALAEDRQFLKWFIRNQINDSKGKQITTLYFSSSFALEFLLIVMIYFSDSFPEQAESLYAFMSNIGLLQQSKQFINHQSVRRFLQVFHMQTNRSEEFSDFANRIQDRQGLSYFT